MKNKLLYIILIDISGSISQHLSEITAQMSKLIDGLKQIDDDVFIQVLGLCEQGSESFKTLVDITSVNKVELPKLETNNQSYNSFDGIKEAINSAKKWNKKYFYNKIFNFDCKVSILLITDITENLIKEREKEIIGQLNSGAKDKNFSLFCFKVADAFLNDFDNKHCIVEESTNLSIALDHLNIQKPLKKIFDFISKKVKNNPFKAFFEITLFSFISITIIDIGITIFQYISINLNFNIINEKELRNFEEKYDSTSLNINVNILFKGCHNNLVLSYEYVDSTRNYKVSEYSTNSSNQINKAALLLIENLSKIEKRYNLNGKVIVSIAGETDGIPVKSIKYKGEYGTLLNKPMRIYRNNFINALTSINYKDDTVNIKEGGRLTTNLELSFLRGYAFQDLIRRQSDIVITQPATFFQYGKENKDLGGDYRKVIVLIEFYNVNPK